MRRGVARQDAGEARVDKGFDLARDRDEPRAAISGKRSGMIEAAGVEVEMRGAVPRAGDGLGKEPAAVALTGIGWDQSDEG